MDIRNFFGSNATNEKKKDPSTTVSDTVKGSKTKKSKLVIEDDEDDAPIELPPAHSKSGKEDIPPTSSSSISTSSSGHSSGSSGSSEMSSSHLRTNKDNANGHSSANNTKKELNESEIDFDESVISPSMKKIITWKRGSKVPYKAVVDTFDAVGAISGRLEKESLLSRLFQAVLLTSPSELEAVVYLISNEVAPSYEGLELGIGDSLLVKAVSEATGRTKNSVQDDYTREGDLGKVALSSRAKQNTLNFGAKLTPLSVSDVLEKFRSITKIKGDRAQQRKVDVIKALMIKCQGNEAMYIVRALQGKLRIGIAAQTVLVSLATAFAACVPQGIRKMMEEDKFTIGGSDGEDIINEIPTDNEADNEVQWYEHLAKIRAKQPVEAVKLQQALAGPKDTKRKAGFLLQKEQIIELTVIAVKRAFSECPSLTLLVQALLSTPIYMLYRACRLRPGLPIAPMLAKPTKQVNEVLKRLSGLAFTMEYKYDGERAQVHLLDDGSVRVFSRNSLDDSEKYPDLLSNMKNARSSQVVNCIVDAEVVAWDRETNKLLPFQILSTRKRKVEDGDEDNQKVKVVLQAFDLLYLNGKSLLQETLRTRRRYLRTAFREVSGLFYFASGQDLVEDGDTEVIESYLTEACSLGTEGLMVKTLDDNATYEPSKRSLNWLKLKKDYIDGMGVCDSVDLVVMGAWHGKGKRTNTFGVYLMGCYDPERDEIQSVCKVGTGFKDEELTRFTTQMQEHAAPNQRTRPFNYITQEGDPDVWFNAKVVWELQAADLTKSSKHMGALGIVDPERGIGLRFPRFIRERPDKKPEGATNAEQIADMYRSQDLNEVGGADGDEEDDNDDI